MELEVALKLYSDCLLVASEPSQVVTTKKRKLDLSEKDNFTFRYGVQDFAEVSRGFYVDKTQFITHLEASKSQVFVFFRPRRFGKSLFLSTLSYFYDVFRRDDFEPLFKELSIYSDPKLNTYKKNEYFVMHWSFSALDTSHGVEEFDRSLTREVNSAIRALIDKYSYLVILQPIIYEEDPVSSLSNLVRAISNTNYKLYLLVDEYDTSVNDIIKSQNKDLLNYLKDKSLSSFQRLFSGVKNCLTESTLAHVFITGVTPLALNNFTSGFNVATELTFDPTYADLCGFLKADLVAPLNSIATATQSGDELLQICTKEFDGYSFGADHRVYNSTMCLSFMKYFSSNKKLKLDDTNVIPSNSALAFLSTHHLLPRLISLLISTRKVSFAKQPLEAPLLETLDVEKLVSPDNFDTRTLLSFLYYTGTLTIDSLEDTKTTLRIPNDHVYRNTLGEVTAMYDLQKSNVKELQEAITMMFNGDIQTLALYISSKMLSLLKHNDVAHSLESDLKSMFILSVVIALGNNFQQCAESEYDIEGTQADAFFRHQDPTVKFPFVHIEFKNTTIGQIDGFYGNWDFMNAKNLKVNEMSENELLKLKLKFPLTRNQTGNYLRDREVRTIGDMWENTKAQTKLNSKKIKENHISYCIYRIGLSRLLISLDS
jgi:hypothetical protein